MKKSITLFSSILLTINLFAEQVSPEKAVSIAKNFITQQSSNANARTSGELDFEQVFPKINSKNKRSEQNSLPTPYYIYNFNNNGGFIIIAGDDASMPILGYSFEGFYNDTIISPQFAKWMEGYKNQIRYIKENQITPTKEITNKWAELQSNKKSNSNSREEETQSVAPLIQTKWNQNPYYNNLCPRKFNWLTLSYEERAVTGCVATAMAQIMKYWNSPTQGSGFHSYNHSKYGLLSADFGSTTYDWANMPNQLSSSTTTVQNNAVAELMYHCGISVDMVYGLAENGGSSAYVISTASPVTTICSEFALKKYFGYKNTLNGIERKNYTNFQWLNLLKAEFNANRPVLYAGSGSGGGHCFVADGYDANDFVHFNWGWGGLSDGHFNIDALNPKDLGTGAGLGEFNSDQQAIIGIEPGIVSTVNLALYSNISTLPVSVTYGDAITAKVNIVNNGASTFNGDYTIGIFNSNGAFVGYLETKTNESLPSTLIYTGGLTFTGSQMLKMFPGVYSMTLYYRVAGGEWSAVKNGSYSNYTTITVNGVANDLKVYENFSINTGNIIKNTPFTVTFNLANFGSSTFNGDIQLALYNLEDGSFVTSIGTKTGLTLDGGYYFINSLVISSTGINLSPGSYLLAVQNKSTNGSYVLSGSSTLNPNPITIIVEEPPILPDMYENNNSQTLSYNLPISFSGNSASKLTTGSNLHIGTDIDHYKISLPTGYNYSINGRVHDSYSSRNGNSYTADVLFSISDGTNTTETYDDAMASPYQLNNGGTLYFKIAPYFAGVTGSYLLDLNITRSPVTVIDEIRVKDSEIILFPNPSTDKINFKNLGMLETTNLSVVNSLGKLVIEIANFDFKNSLDISHLPVGLYFINFQNKEIRKSQKFNISR
ncbi:MAG: T9SS C-terminal target domain-containing protein [Bacteroidetes bacterium]|nr:MAG: T9SS C-terminal target domain-containing protein [Bacteroidota bacterium]